MFLNALAQRRQDNRDNLAAMAFNRATFTNPDAEEARTRLTSFINEKKREMENLLPETYTDQQLKQQSTAIIRNSANVDEPGARLAIGWLHQILSIRGPNPASYSVSREGENIVTTILIGSAEPAAAPSPSPSPSTLSSISQSDETSYSLSILREQIVRASTLQKKVNASEEFKTSLEIAKRLFPEFRKKCEIMAMNLEQVTQLAAELRSGRPSKLGFRLVSPLPQSRNPETEDAGCAQTMEGNIEAFCEDNQLFSRSQLDLFLDAWAAAQTSGGFAGDGESLKALAFSPETFATPSSETARTQLIEIISNRRDEMQRLIFATPSPEKARRKSIKAIADLAGVSSEHAASAITLSFTVLVNLRASDAEEELSLPARSEDEAKSAEGLAGSVSEGARLAIEQSFTALAKLNEADVEEQLSLQMIQEHIVGALKIKRETNEDKTPQESLRTAKSFFPEFTWTYDAMIWLLEGATNIAIAIDKGTSVTAIETMFNEMATQQARPQADTTPATPPLAKRHREGKEEEKSSSAAAK